MKSEKNYPLKIDKVILSCFKEDTCYIDNWDLIKNRWRRIGIDPELVIVDYEDNSLNINKEYYKNLKHIFTAANYKNDIVMLANIKYIPGDARYFMNGLRNMKYEDILLYRSLDKNFFNSFPIAKGTTWKSILSGDNFKDFLEIHRESINDCINIQCFLYRLFSRNNKNVIELSDNMTGFNNLSKKLLNKDTFEKKYKNLIKFNVYTQIEIPDDIKLLQMM